MLLREIVAAIRRYGPPTAVRTDNEAVFTSRTFRSGLWLLGIRHQRTQVMAPWQNGRIERFFGTFKERWTRYRERGEGLVEDLQTDLETFRTWYNHVRPHQHLGGRVPAEVWEGGGKRQCRHRFVSNWKGVLTGYFFY